MSIDTFVWDDTQSFAYNIVVRLYGGNLTDEEAGEVLQEHYKISGTQNKRLSSLIQEAVITLDSHQKFQDDPEHAYFLYVQDIGGPGYSPGWDRTQYFIDLFEESFMVTLAEIEKLGARHD